MPTFSFKAAPAEARAIRAAARARGLTVSEYLRRAALPGPRTRSRARRTFRPGRVVVRGSDDAPTVTTADVAAALYE